MTSTIAFGLRCCELCGHGVLGTDVHPLCRRCGAPLPSESKGRVEVHGTHIEGVAEETAAIALFSSGELQRVRDYWREQQRAAQEGKEATEKDSRVVEEAFCDKCQQVRPCRTYARQIRGADEGQTIFYECTVCKSVWQVNS